jgi:NADPH:quinone reductase-like Zn-dependent oxidoreductase
VTGFGAGDEVWGFLNGVRQVGLSGAAAEYVLAPAKSTALRPGTISAIKAAALSGVGASAIGVLRDAVRLRPAHRTWTGCATSAPPRHSTTTPLIHTSWAGLMSRWTR